MLERIGGPGAVGCSFCRATFAPILIVADGVAGRPHKGLSPDLTATLGGLPDDDKADDRR